MSLMDSKGALSKASKEIFARWNDLKSTWSDAQSQEFEKTYLFQIEQDVRSALSAMDSMDLLMKKIQNDCE